jgi:hypothetical protein
MSGVESVAAVIIGPLNIIQRERRKTNAGWRYLFNQEYKSAPVKSHAMIPGRIVDNVSETPQVNASHASAGYSGFTR